MIFAGFADMPMIYLTLYLMLFATVCHCRFPFNYDLKLARINNEKADIVPVFQLYNKRSPMTNEGNPIDLMDFEYLIKMDREGKK